MIAPNTSQPSAQVGTNLGGVTYYSTQLPFIDLFKTSAPWLTQRNGSWNTQEADKLDLDANGWVKSLPQPGSSTSYTQVGTLINRVDGQYPGGKYVVLYDGEGTINYGYDAKRDVTASQPGRDVIDVNPSGSGIYLNITATDPNKTGNYIRNIRVVPEAYENTYQTQIFNPELLEKIDDFSTLRFMDWMRTNGSDQGDWSQRPKPTDATYASSKGVPIETMIDLANRLGKDPWFTIPHEASDEYVANFAQLVKERLNPNLKAYVEYSNEVWNGMFEQHNWVQEQAAKEGLDWYEWYGRRVEQIGDIWDSVLGNDRVVTVLAGQSANPWVAEQELKAAKAYDPNLTIDAIATAPYFGGYLGSPSNAAQVESWTASPDGGLNQLFTELAQGGVLTNGPVGGALEQASKGIVSHANLAEQENLDLIAYEGGQHLVGTGGVENNQAITDLFIKANRDSRMGDLYREYLAKWEELGGGLFVNFSDVGTPSKWGSWGTLEYVGQDTSPKYQALLDFINRNPAVDPNAGGSTPIDPNAGGSTPIDPNAGGSSSGTSGNNGSTTPDPNAGGSTPIDPGTDPTSGNNSGGSNPGTISGTPVSAIADTATTSINTPININVLQNDTLSDDFTLSLVNNPSQGSAQINDNGTPGDRTDDFILYTPDNNLTGSDEFTYQLSNSSGVTTATVSVSIAPLDPSSIPSGTGGSQTGSNQGGSSSGSSFQPGLIDLLQPDLNQDGQVDADVILSFSSIDSEAGYDNSVGFYRIANEQGAVLDTVSGRLIQPGEAGYAQAAIQQRLQDVDLTRNTGNSEARISAGTLLAPYLIADSTAEEFLAQNTTNQAGGPNAYFAFMGANPDQTEHIRVLDGNRYAFEDLWGGGDRDFNDFTFQANLKVA